MITEKDVRDAVASVNPEYDAAALPTDSPFGEAGLDSLDHASILLALQEKTGVEFPDDVDEIDSISKILAYVNKQQS